MGPAGPTGQVLLPLADECRIRLEVDVVDLHPHEFRTSRTGMGGENQHRVEMLVLRRRTGEFQELDAEGG